MQVLQGQRLQQPMFDQPGQRARQGNQQRGGWAECLYAGAAQGVCGQRQVEQQVTDQGGADQGG